MCGFWMVQRRMNLLGWVVVMVLCLSMGMSAYAGDIVKDFGLKMTMVQNAIVYYDPVLEGRLPEFRFWYINFKDNVLSNLGVSEDKVGPVCDAINRIIGTERDEAKTAAKRVLVDINQVFNKLSFDKPIFYLIQTAPIKAYLRQGETLPHFNYDKQTDMASYEMQFNFSETSEKTPFELVFPIDPNETAKAEIFDGMFELLSTLLNGMMKPMVIHEAAEMTLLNELNTQDCYRRWFTDGFANVVVYQIMKELYSQKEADDYLAVFSAKPYEDIRTQINLRYWLGMEYDFFDTTKPFEAESRIQWARYNFATQEAMGLTQRHGADCLKKIVDVYCAKGVRTSEGLYDAIADATGENLDLAFAKYQSFTDAMGGLKYYAAQYEAAAKKNDTIAQIQVRLRMMELYTNPFSPLSLTTRKDIAVLLMKAGRQDLGDQGILTFAARMMRGKAPWIGMEMLMVYAGETSRPEIAEMVADAMLKQAPQIASAKVIKARIVQLREQSPKMDEQLRQAERKGEFYTKAKQLLESGQK